MSEASSDDSRLDRRTFIKDTACGVAAAAAVSAFHSGALARTSAAALKSETLVAQLYQSLSREQRNSIVFPFDHPLRSKVDNNWQITKQRVSMFNADQQGLIREIFLNLHSPEYAQPVLKQVEHDAGRRGFGGCSVALFGEPGTGRFEFVLTGRHCTRRCDGDSVEGAAFGGPIFYGHAAQGFREKPHHPGNAYWYQAQRANQVFGMLDSRQRDLALLGTARQERGTETVKLTGRSVGLPGIPLTEMSLDQRGLVRRVLGDVLAPFRKEDVDESLRLVERSGIENLHMAFYRNHDVGGDGIWDVWQIEGPAMILYFRGDPHVHAWLHIRDQA